MTRQLLFYGLFGLALSLAASAQPPGPGPVSNPAGGSIPGASLPGGLNQPGTYPSSLEQEHAAYVTGKVILEDGAPPADPVVIQLVCHGVPRSVTYTDLKGHFSLDLAGRSLMTRFAEPADGSDGVDRPPGSPGLSPQLSGDQAGAADFGQADLLNCELLANHAGFRSDSVQLGARRLNNPDVGTLTLHHLAGVQGLTISSTSALAPKDAKKAMEKGVRAGAEKKWPEAQKQLEKAVAADPKYAAAWYELGNVQRVQNNLEGARQSYAKALEADPEFVMPYGILASMAAKEKNWQEAADASNHLIQLDPVDFPDAWVLNAFAYYGLRKWDLAEKSAKEGLAHDPQHHYPKLNQVLGALMAMERDYAGSAQNFREYLRYAPNASDAEQVKKELADLEKVLEPQANK
ncbi:MAG TPA: tetratricopeptide repeat protein [Bryobacteraceae bacterium]|nr:tetratricopeptide repeat protein [Bryobacteraceae bacterium]